MYEQEYIKLLESQIKILSEDLHSAEILLSYFSTRHYQDGLTKSQIIKMSKIYFDKINQKYITKRKL